MRFRWTYSAIWTVSSKAGIIPGLTETTSPPLPLTWKVCALRHPGRAIVRTQKLLVYLQTDSAGTALHCACRRCRRLHGVRVVSPVWREVPQRCRGVSGRGGGGESQPTVPRLVVVVKLASRGTERSRIQRSHALSKRATDFTAVTAHTALQLALNSNTSSRRGKRSRTK